MLCFPPTNPEILERARPMQSRAGRKTSVIGVQAVRRACFLAVALVVLTLPGRALAEEAGQTPKPVRLVVDARASTVAYTVENALHSVVATTREPEGVLALLPDGGLQVMVRASVRSFDSDNSNRDAHMLEVMDAMTHPHVVFKGVVPGFTPPAEYPATVRVDVRGVLDFRGRKNPETVPVELVFVSPTEVRASARFDVSLTRYGVPLPSVMFVTLKDRCAVALDLVLKGTP